MQTIRLRINKPLASLAAGAIIELKVDAAGVILDDYWRARLIDAKLDNCVTVMGDNQSNLSKKGKE